MQCETFAKKWKKIVKFQLFEKFKVDQSGYDRGGAGRQELKPLKLERALSDESIDDLSQMMANGQIDATQYRAAKKEISNKGYASL